MVNYRRVRIPDATYFFTVTLRDRRSDLLIREIDALKTAWRCAKARVPHTIVAMVVLPEHLHALLQMNDDSGDYPRLWRDIKTGFTRSLNSQAGSSPWQARYWEHTIRDDNDLHRHIDYVHANPLKHGLVTRIADWPHSTFHRYVRDGLLPVDWSGTMDRARTFGER